MIELESDASDGPLADDSGQPLDERMKGYEAVFHARLCRRVPVIVRVDGRAFHGVVPRWPNPKPFCRTFMFAMVGAAQQLAADMQGFRLGYAQSDEASFLLVDYDRLSSEPWFGYDVQKMASITAAEMTRAFAGGPADGTFDARVFNVPREDVVNYFLWRARDWSRNSLQMYARAFFSHKELHGAGREQMHEMLHSIGKNWTTDLDEMTRNGSWLTDRPPQVRHDLLPTYSAVAALVDPLLAQRGEE